MAAADRAQRPHVMPRIQHRIKVRPFEPGAFTMTIDPVQVACHDQDPARLRLVGPDQFRFSEQARNGRAAPAVPNGGLPDPTPLQ